MHRLSHQRRVWRVCHARRGAAPHLPLGCAGHRQDRHHGASRRRARLGARRLFDDSPYAPVCHRAALYHQAQLWRARSGYLRVHHERDHRQHLREHRADKAARGHLVPRRDQLRERDPHADDAALFAEQDARQPPRARRLGHRERRQPARIQQERQDF